MRWNNVEYVLLKAINIIGQGQLSDLTHREPHWPSLFAYVRPHASEKFAKRAKSASLNAFQRMLAYCSYCTAYACANGRGGTLDPEGYFNNPSLADDLFRRFGENQAGSNAQILFKFLWATLGEIQRSRNFVGIVVSYHREFHYPAVRTMASYGVPVYVRWNKDFRLQSYDGYGQHHMLKDWAPSLDDFKILEAPPSPSDDLATGSFTLRAPLTYRPGPTRLETTFGDPMEYINQRKAIIQGLFENHKATEGMKSRQMAAAKFGSLSHKGAFVFEFQRADHVDPATGKKSVLWERKQLTKHDGLLTYNAAYSAQLWHVPVRSLLLFIP